MTALIIDDEELARNILKTYLRDYPTIEVIGECANGFEGLKSIQELKPDLIFLDVQMPKITGFEMLELLENRPMIVFSTAYNEFAIRAFELNAVDYLLKPYSRQRFDAAIGKVLERFANRHQEKENVPQLLEQVQQQTTTLERVVVKTGSKIQVVAVDRIHYLEAQDDYVMLYTDDGKYLKQWTMKYFEDHLNSTQFVRIHRSYIVKIEQIARLEPYEKASYVLILKDKTQLPVSKTGYATLKDALNF